jgi:hypothetical protein
LTSRSAGSLSWRDTSSIVRALGVATSASGAPGAARGVLGGSATAISRLAA